MSYTDLRNIPTRYRRWYIERLVKEIKTKADAQKAAIDKSRSKTKKTSGIF